MIIGQRTNGNRDVVFAVLAGQLESLLGTNGHAAAAGDAHQHTLRSPDALILTGLIMYGWIFHHIKADTVTAGVKQELAEFGIPDESLADAVDFSN